MPNCTQKRCYLSSDGAMPPILHSAAIFLLLATCRQASAAIWHLLAPLCAAACVFGAPALQLASGGGEGRCAPAATRGRIDGSPASSPVYTCVCRLAGGGRHILL